MKRSLQLALVLGVAALATSLWLKREDAARSEGSRSAGATAKSEATVPLVSKRPRTDARIATRPDAPRMVLPPEDVPLAPELEALARAARRGDVGAMCRLAFELHRCDVDLPSARSAVESVTESVLNPNPGWRIEGQTEEDRLRVLAAHTTKRDKLEVICAGVKTQPGLEPWRLSRDASRAGHVSSMVRFAASMPFDSMHLLSDIEGLKAFRDEAPSFLRRAVAAGDPQAAYLLVQVYRGSGGMIGQIGRIPEDPGLALAYALALNEVGDEATQRWIDEQEGKLRRRLSPAGQREAEKFAGQLTPLFASSRGAKLDLRTGLNKSGSEACATPVQSQVLEHTDRPIAPVALDG